MIEALIGARAMLYRGDAGETFCLALAEAQALGLPAVVQDLGAVAERVIDGVTGTVAADEDAFVAAAIALLGDDALWRRQHDSGTRAPERHKLGRSGAALRGVAAMTRLLQTMAGQAHGGAEAFFERLALALARAGETQRLVIRGDGARMARLRAAGLDVLEAPFRGRLDWRTRPLLRRAIAAFRPDVVLSWMSRASAACPRGAFVHVGRLGGYYDLKYYRGCDHLIANTRDIVAYVVRHGWPAARVHYLPNFVTGQTAPPLPRASLATPDDVPLALALGRLHHNKGFDVLLEAVAKVPRLHLWLAGDGDERAVLEGLARTLGIEDRVHFLGWRDDVAALLAACDMLVSSSRHEPLGNVVIEAWAAGAPVVASASEGPRALIRDGENGLLVPIEDADALAAALARLAADRALAPALAAGGRAAFEAEFTEARVVALYREFLAQVRR